MFSKPVIHNWDREVDMNYKGIYKAKVIIRLAATGQRAPWEWTSDRTVSVFACYCTLRSFCRVPGTQWTLSRYLSKWTKRRSNEWKNNKWMIECQAKPTGPNRCVFSLFLPHSPHDTHPALLFIVKSEENRNIQDRFTGHFPSQTFTQQPSDLTLFLCLFKWRCVPLS